VFTCYDPYDVLFRLSQLLIPRCRLAYKDFEVGTGSLPEEGQEVVFQYTGYNESGGVIDSSYRQRRPAQTRVGINGMIPGAPISVVQVDAVSSPQHKTSNNPPPSAITRGPALFDQPQRHLREQQGTGTTSASHRHQHRQQQRTGHFDSMLHKLFVTCAHG
jgi:hypothetical protein